MRHPGGLMGLRVRASDQIDLFCRMKYHRIVTLSLFSIILPTLAQAQRDEHLAFDRPEAWAMKYFTAVGTMQGNGPPVELGAGKWALGLEISNIPELDLEERTVGFNGTKEEDLNKASILARPLVHYGISDRFRLSLTASYVPPFEVFDGLKTHLASLSVNHDIFRGERYILSVRLIGQWSEAEGDFTAPENVIGDPDPDKNPFEAISPSEDVYTSWTNSFETTLFYRLKTKRESTLFLSVTYTYADLDFEVYVPQPEGEVHNRHLTANGSLWNFATGFSHSLTEKISMRLAAVYSPLDVRRPPEYKVEDDSLFHFRLMINYRL